MRRNIYSQKISRTAGKDHRISYPSAAKTRIPTPPPDYNSINPEKSGIEATEVTEQAPQGYVAAHSAVISLVSPTSKVVKRLAAPFQNNARP
jgi:hypothetical protein